MERVGIFLTKLMIVFIIVGFLGASITLFTPPVHRGVVVPLTNIPLILFAVWFVFKRLWR